MSETLRKQLTYWSDSVLSQRNPLRSWEAEELLRVRISRARCIQEEIPANLEQFASAVGVRDIRYLALPMRGRLVSEDNALIVEINEQLSELDRRFVLAHEIAHVILEGGQSSRVSESRLGNRQDNPVSERAYRRLENLCDEAAREILLPVHVLRSNIDGKRPSLELLLELARQAQARPDVIASQILRARAWDCRLFFWRQLKHRWMAVQSVPPRSEGELVWLDIENAPHSIVERANVERRLVCGPVTLQDSDQRHRYESAEASPDQDGSVLLMIPLE